MSSKPLIIFSNNDVPSDTEGALPAAVSFVQNCVMPSVHQVPSDKQQHLVSLRRTMVLLRPQIEVFPNEKIAMVAKDVNDKVVHESTMLPPDDLPKFCGQTDFYEEVSKPESYDLTIGDNNRLNKFKGDTEGNYFRQLLNGYSSVTIKISDDHMVQRFYLPRNEQFDEKIVSFSSSATQDSEILFDYPAQSVKQVNNGMEITFENFNGVWVSSSDDEKVTKPGSFDTDITQNNKLRKFDDTEAVYLKKILSSADKLHLITSNGNWSQNFYLPYGKSFNGKIVTITSHAGWGSRVLLNYRSQTLKAGDEVTFKNVYGAWNITDDAKGIDPASATHRVISGDEVYKFVNDVEGKQLKELFSHSDALHIKTSDGNHTTDFHLPSGPEFGQKFVTFTSTAGYNSTVTFNNDSRTLRKGSEINFKNVGGLWHTPGDAATNRIRYSDKAYSGVLPAQILKPGLKLSFVYGDKEGHINILPIGAPNELLLHTIDLGMLTSPRDEFTFQKDHELHRQYFQQIPAYKLTVSEYEPVEFSTVVLASGQVLTDFDPSMGSGHGGTMRQAIAKMLVSHGIDNANYGLNSSGGVGPNWHLFLVAQLTAFTARGLYSNGVQVHGYSGGNGIVTLASSTGNEFSHEVGHNYGLGHFPGGFNGSINRPSNQVNSTWGWDSDKNFFIPNFEAEMTNQPKWYHEHKVEPFAGHRFGSGAMSSGEPLYPRYNAFTLYTPYELNHIQNFLEGKAVFAKDSQTGFKKWDERNQEMVVWENLLNFDLEENPQNHEGAQVLRAPYKQGVAVATILGFYDPSGELKGYIYPAFHGSFGAVYEDNFKTSPWQLKVSTESAGVKVFNLHPRRLDDGNMNKFHINVEEDLKPHKVELTHNDTVVESLEITGPRQTLTTSVVSHC